VGRGLQAEILVSLAIVMLTATGMLGIVLIKTQEAEVDRLSELAVRELVAEARSPLGLPRIGTDGVRWWMITPDGAHRVEAGSDRAPADGSRALVEEARRLDEPIVASGRLWDPIRLAVPVERGGAVALAELPPGMTRQLFFGLLLADVLIFTGFGAYLLRRRLIAPLERLAEAARWISEGDFDVRAPTDGVRETAAVGHAFNDMTDALARRSADLEKAIAELRESNRSLRSARAGLDRAERLAAVGRLAAGVAHEVGNPMGAMLAFLDLVGRDAGLSEASRQHLDRASSEGQRVRTILRQLLDFSRPPRLARVPVDLPTLCEKTAGLVRAQRRYAAIAIEVRSEGDPPAALADPTGVSQILLNLLLNAADALLQGSADPRIDIVVAPAVANVRRGDGEDAAPRRRKPDCVECRVADNGPGIAPEDRERIFDPFFSTKAPGEGTGLGLSNAARFAEEFGGSLSLDPGADGSGARFVLRLPAVPGAGAPGGARAAG
jgi:signal transduction histidine kinase